MGRIIYPNGWRKVDFLTDVIRVHLVRSTSSYVPNVDHDFLDDFTGGGGVFISVASYVAQTLASKAITYDTVKNQVEYDAADPAFGSLESGQTVKAILVVRQVGGDDTTPADDDLILYDDGLIDLTLAADAALNATTIYVDPLEADIPNGKSLDFGGGATCDVNAAASRGDRKLTTTAIAAAGTNGDISAGVETDSILPAVLQNGPFNLQLHGDGLIVETNRGLFAT